MGLDDRRRLRVQDRGARLGALSLEKLKDKRESTAGIGNIIDDEQALAFNSLGVKQRREEDRIGKGERRCKTRR